MADNVVLPGTGVTIGSDQVTDGTLGTVQVQYVKLMAGALDSTTKVDATANGLSVDLKGVGGSAFSLGQKTIANSLSVGFASDYWPTFSQTLSAAGLTSGTSANAVHHTLQVVITGSPSAATIRLEGSLDGTNYFDISGTFTCTSSLMFHVTQRPVAFVRANLQTWTGGTNAAISYRGAN